MRPTTTRVCVSACVSRARAVVSPLASCMVEGTLRYKTENAQRANLFDVTLLSRAHTKPPAVSSSARRPWYADIVPCCLRLDLRTSVTISPSSGLSTSPCRLTCIDRVIHRSARRPSAALRLQSGRPHWHGADLSQEMECTLTSNTMAPAPPCGLPKSCKTSSMVFPASWQVGQGTS